MSFQNKFMKRLFRRVDNVVIDATTGKVGVRGDDGVYTISFDKDKTHTVSVDIFDQFNFSIPGFASQVEFEKVKAGDLVLNDKGIGGWVVDKTSKTLKLADHTGSIKTYQPPKVNILGTTAPGTNGVLVVQTLFSLTGSAEGAAGLGQSLLPLMLLGGDNNGTIDKLLPLMLMQGASGGEGMNPMMLMLAMKDGGLGGGDDKLLKLMALGGLGGNAGGAMNPMMLMALMGDGDLFGSSTPARGVVAPALKRTGAPALKNIGW